MKTLKKIVLMCLATLLLVSCGKGNNDKKVDSGKEIKNIMFVVTGNLGGGTNNDDVYAAIKTYADEVKGKVSTFECNMDTSLYESTLMQSAESGEYDLIITGFGTMVEPLSATAEKYPDQKFMIFDTAMKYENDKNKNVVSVQVLQNEGGFLAGAMAALVTNSKAKLANADKKVGFVGAMESTAILDFLVGYIEGVNYVDKEVEVVYSFVGNHKDTALAKELALSNYQQGSDVIFAVGGNGMGVAEAAKDKDKYVIGVDFDYSERLKKTSAEAASHVLTSVVKDYKGMVLPILKKMTSSDFKWGTHSFISFADGGVFLVDNDYTKAILTGEERKKYEQIVEDLESGKIKVKSAFGMSTEQINEVKKLALPQK